MKFSMKLGLISVTVLSTAIIFKLLPSLFTDFAVSDLSAFWTSIISWLKPPYLYVVINCIIITIVASSRLQSRIDDSLSPPPTSLVAAEVLLPTEPLKAVAVPQVHDPHVSYDAGVVLRTEAVEERSPVQFSDAGYEGEKIVEVSEPDLRTQEFSDDARDFDTKTAMEAYEEIMKKGGNKSVRSMSSRTPSKTDLGDRRPPSPVERPPASARFSHRKPVKASPEGGRTLGVSKPKRQDTLETTWKTITEGRSIPLTRHLRKSDTWETRGQDRHNRISDDFIDHSSHKMTQSDTFDVNHRKTAATGLKKEPSLGQEELNRKVEAFIRKFNEDMRLQRQESLNQYMEMINRGAH